MLRVCVYRLCVIKRQRSATAGGRPARRPASIRAEQLMLPFFSIPLTYGFRKPSNGSMISRQLTKYQPTRPLIKRKRGLKKKSYSSSLFHSDKTVVYLLGSANKLVSDGP